MRTWGLVFCALGALGCDEEAVEQDGITFAVAPLSLPGVTDACYTLTVDNGVDTVWSLGSICSSQYGNSAGAISYVGTCDASVAGNNFVTLELEGLYKGGTWQSGTELLDGTDYVNPCPVGEDNCVLDFKCVENADVLVQFNLTIMRAAEQGFFDIAVNFDDIFCSAKVDCQDELLFGDGGVRDATAVLAFACTAGEDANTSLYMSNVSIVCTNNGSNYTSYGVFEPVGAGQHPGPNSFFDGYAVYQGAEQLGDYNKAFWNLAIAVDEDVLFANNRTCSLIGWGSASDGALTAAATPANTTSPFIAFDVVLNPHGLGQNATKVLGCDPQPMDGAGSGVTTEYDNVTARICFQNKLVRGAGYTVATSTTGVKAKPFSGRTGVADPSCPACVGGVCSCPAGQTVDASGQCQEARVFKQILPDTFTMGSPTDDLGPGSGVGGLSWGENQHQVTLTKSFWMQTTEVTQAQWQSVWATKLGAGTYNPSFFRGASLPVDQVNWYDAAAYMNALSQQESRSVCYDLSSCSGSPQFAGSTCSSQSMGPLPNCTGFRFPTEAEWEYAARATTTGPYYSWTGVAGHPAQLQQIAWYNAISANSTKAVKQKLPNAWGLYDMLGNVDEWVGDWFATGGYPTGPVTDPTGPGPTFGTRMIRGGSYLVDAFQTRAARRTNAYPFGRLRWTGFRIVRSGP